MCIGSLYLFIEGFVGYLKKCNAVLETTKLLLVHHNYVRINANDQMSKLCLSSLRPHRHAAIAIARKWHWGCCLISEKMRGKFHLWGRSKSSLVFDGKKQGWMSNLLTKGVGIVWFHELIYMHVKLPHLNWSNWPDLEWPVFMNFNRAVN